MTERDVYLSDMNSLWDDSALDRVLDDRATADDAPVLRLVEELRQAFPMKEIAGEVEGAQVAAILAAARAQEDPTPVIVAGRASVFERVRSSLATRVAVLVAAATTSLGGAAYAGALPPPLQAAISNAAELVGIDLPHPDDVSSGGHEPDEGDARGLGDDQYVSRAREPQHSRGGIGRAGGSPGPDGSSDVGENDGPRPGAGSREGDDRDSNHEATEPEDGKENYPEVVRQDDDADEPSEPDDAGEGADRDGEEEDSDGPHADPGVDDDDDSGESDNSDVDDEDNGSDLETDGPFED